MSLRSLLLAFRVGLLGFDSVHQGMWSLVSMCVSVDMTKESPMWSHLIEKSCGVALADIIVCTVSACCIQWSLSQFVGGTRQTLHVVPVHSE